MSEIERVERSRDWIDGAVCLEERWPACRAKQALRKIIETRQAARNARDELRALSAHARELSDRVRWMLLRAVVERLHRQIMGDGDE